MSLDLAIMVMVDDPKRRADLISVQARLQGLKATVIPGSKATTLWQSARKAWQTVMVGPGSHGLVLQEDMLPCPNFRVAVEGAIAARPNDILCLFTSRHETLVRPAREAGKSWAVAPDATWGGSVVLPKVMIPKFLAWERMYVSPDYRHDDGRLALWAMATGRKVWVTVPSLLEHVGATRSVQGYGGGINRNRVASWYAEDGAAIDWTQGADDPVMGKAMLGPVTKREWKRIQEAIAQSR